MIALEQTGDALMTGGMKPKPLRIVAARLALELLRCKMGNSCLLHKLRHAELVSASIAQILSMMQITGLTVTAARIIMSRARNWRGNGLWGCLGRVA
jgi:hypothetical protein